jgi:hypothetical protein
MPDDAPVISAVSDMLAFLCFDCAESQSTCLVVLTPIPSGRFSRDLTVQHLANGMPP